MSLVVASPQFCLFSHEMISADSRYIAHIDLSAKYKEETGHIALTPNQLQLENSQGGGEGRQSHQTNILLEHQYARYRKCTKCHLY